LYLNIEYKIENEKSVQRFRVYGQMNVWTSRRCCAMLMLSHIVADVFNSTTSRSCRPAVNTKNHWSLFSFSILYSIF